MRRASLPFRSKKPIRRRRALTPPFSPETRPLPYFFTQSQCPLLFDLPYELRVQIYCEILGSEPVDMEVVEEWGEGKIKKKKKKKGEKATKGSIDGVGTGPRTAVALMRTCRLIYTELHPLLLSLPLAVPTLATLRYHLDHIPTTHYHHITILDLQAALPYLLFPVRQLPAPNSWLSRTIKQLQHFDVPQWTYIWDMLSGGSVPGPSFGSGSSNVVPPRSASISGGAGGAGGVPAGLTGLRYLRVYINARDYTSMHPEWPGVPEDIVAVLLWEPVLACARARGWPQHYGRGSPHDIPRKFSSTVGADGRNNFANRNPNPNQLAPASSSRTAALARWSIDVSWALAPEKYGKGWPPQKLMSREEIEAGLPFTLRSVGPKANALSTTSAEQDFGRTEDMPGGGGDGEGEGSEESSSTDGDGDGGAGAEDEGYRSGRDDDVSWGAGVEGESDQGRKDTQRQWWER